MSEIQVARLGSPAIAKNVALRLAKTGFTAIKDRQAQRSDFNYQLRLERGLDLLDVLSQFPLGQPVMAQLALPVEGGYSRLSQEKSGCPVLRAKHSVMGQFVIARATEAQPGGTKFCRFSHFIDATVSHDDVLLKREGKLGGDSVAYYSETSFKGRRDIGKTSTVTRAPMSARQLLEVINIFDHGITTTDHRHITAAVEAFDKRVQQYRQPPPQDYLTIDPNSVSIPKQPMGVVLPFKPRETAVSYLTVESSANN
ncbi:hypothetical protein H7Y63_02510 [Polaromonas sp.]|nr:hypothetical protein [Candidatus Saccharibacteria bacterium]